MSENTHFEKVKEFYKAFDQFIPVGHASLESVIIPEDRVHLKMNLIAEEFIELVEAVYGLESGKVLHKAWAEAQILDEENRDIIETADALADLDYVINGFAIEACIDLDKVFDEVHASNMSKLDDEGRPILSDGVTPAPDGQVKPIGKILKGSNFREPDIKKVLNANPIK